MKILIVDDDHEIAELLEIYVKNEGYEPVIASDGREAMTKIRTNPDIGLIILDIMMPDMNGTEVLKEVRKDNPVPILMLSAKSGAMDKIQGLITWSDGPRPCVVASCPKRYGTSNARSLGHWTFDD